MAAAEDLRTRPVRCSQTVSDRAQVRPLLLRRLQLGADASGVGESRSICSLVTMKMSGEELYLRLRDLLASVPDMAGDDWNTPETHGWLGRAGALMETSGDLGDLVAFRTDVASLAGPLRRDAAFRLHAVLNRALARAEVALPVPVPGTFIAANSPFDALAAVARVVAQAHTDLFFVDPFADHALLSDFARAAPEGVQIRVLTDPDPQKHKPSFLPAVERWRQQFKDARPLEVRFAAPRVLHDRAIFVDRSKAWLLGQSFNKLADRASTTIMRAAPDVGARLRDDHEAHWEKGQAAG